MNTRPATPPDPYEGWTDTQVASRHASDAYRHGRVLLGYELSRVALKAHLHEMRHGITHLPAQPPPIYGQVQADTGFFGQVEVSQPLVDPRAQAEAEFFGQVEVSQPLPGAYKAEPDSAGLSLVDPRAEIDCDRCRMVHLDGDCPMVKAMTYRCVAPDRVVAGGECHKAVWFHVTEGAWYHVDQGVEHLPTVPIEVHEHALAAAAKAAAQKLPKRRPGDGCA